ncbi:hypothetical protein FZW96_00045 [Bacillus sp. BGMRC 2118]|nr:hypothetical protein FZW96_00045 [Bacillus sp. BGMRC 2118]
MKKKFCKIFLIFITIQIGLIGCQTTKEKETEIRRNIVVENAIENGKLALADGNFQRSKSNFELVQSKDNNNKEAKEWLLLVEEIEILSNHITNKEIEKAEKVLERLKFSELYSNVKNQIFDYESSLKTLISSIENIEKEIGELIQKLEEGTFDEVIEKGYILKNEKDITINQLDKINGIIDNALTKKEEDILVQQTEEQNKKSKENKNSESTLSLDEMRKLAKEYVDNWNGYNNLLRDEWDSGNFRVYEFQDGPTEHIIGVTVDYNTGEVTPDQGIY